MIHGLKKEAVLYNLEIVVLELYICLPKCWSAADQSRMSSITVSESVFCSFLGLEMKENSGVFENMFCRLDPQGLQLQYFSANHDVSVAFCG